MCISFFAWWSIGPVNLNLSDITTPAQVLCPKCGPTYKGVATLRGHVGSRDYEVRRCLACGVVLSSDVKGATENIHLLSDLPGRLTTELFASAKRMRLVAGNALFRAGDPGDDCYRIEDGLLKVTIAHSGDERILAFVSR